MDKKRPGDVRLALGLIPDRRHFTVRGNLAATLRLAGQAGRAGADLVAFEEGGISLFAPAHARAVTVPGPETDALAAVARRWRMYVAAAMSQDLGAGRSGNIVVLFDRRGRIATVCRKQQLTIGELRRGIVPGDVCMPVETDFGRIGFLICYDTQFPELARLLGVRGAELLILPHVGGAGPDGGQLLGGGFASANGCWVAWVGRSGTAVISPAGVTVARMNATGRLLVTDIAMNRTRVVAMASETHVDWHGRQFMERRPDYYGHPAPAVEITAPDLPLHAVLSAEPGPHRIELRLRNRSAVRQRGQCVVEFPRQLRYRSDEQQDNWIDVAVAGSWHPRPRTFRFDLAPGRTMPVRIDYTIPSAAFGIFLLRVIGRTDCGERLLWQHQTESFPPVPALDVPRLADAAAVMRSGAPVPLTRDFFGAPARSRTAMRIGWTADALVLCARAFRFGPWKDGEGRCGEAISFAVKPRQDLTTVFWFTVERSGRATAQRREHGTMVRGGLPAWTARARAGARWWDVRITAPFRGMARRPNPGDAWGFNAERRAMLPATLDALRDLAVVRTPELNVAKPSRSVGAERVDWNPTYSRIDCIEHFGVLRFTD